MAMKEEKTRNGGSFDGHTTLRRNVAAKHSGGPLTELQKIRRQNVDSGYSTSDGYDKRWSQELPNSNGSATVTDNGNSSKWSPTQTQSLLNNEKNSPNATNYTQFQSQSQSSGSSTPTLTSPPGSNNNTLTPNQSLDEYVKPTGLLDNSTPKRSSLNGNNRFVSRTEIHAPIAHFTQLISIHQCFARNFITIAIIKTSQTNTHTL